MLVTRQHVVDILRIAALPDAQYGISKDELISRRGGSP